MTQDNSNNIPIIFGSFFFYALLCLLWPEQPENGKLAVALACLLHAIIFHVLAYIFSNYCKNPFFLKTPLAFSCLLLVVYLGVPFMKYYGEARYIELDVGLHYRLFGLLAICIGILLILHLCAKQWVMFYWNASEAMQSSTGPLLTPVMYAVFGLSTFYLITGSIFSDSVLSATQIVFVLSGYFIALYYFALFGPQSKAILNEILFLVGGVAITYYTSQRFALLLAVLLLIFARISRIQSDNRRKSVVLMTLLAAPLAVMLILGPLTAMTKTRHSGVDLIFELQRTDFADSVGAASIAEHKVNVLSGLYTSLLWAVPGSLIEKSSLQYSMEPFYEMNGWRSSDYREGYTKTNIDYVDSLFSGGAMTGGFLGAVLFPLAWYGLFVLVLSRLRGALLLSAFLGSVPALFSLEVAFWNIVPTLRNWLVMTIMLFFVIQILNWMMYRLRQAK